MISKKNKALVAGILAAATSVSAILPAMGSAAENPYASENGANESYASMFESLYADVITNGQENGYLSSQTNGDSFGIPYHSVETLCIEAPDYGHETTQRLCLTSLGLQLCTMYSLKRVLSRVLMT